MFNPLFIVKTGSIIYCKTRSVLLLFAKSSLPYCTSVFNLRVNKECVCFSFMKVLSVVQEVQLQGSLCMLRTIVSQHISVTPWLDLRHRQGRSVWAASCCVDTRMCGCRLSFMDCVQLAQICPLEPDHMTQPAPCTLLQSFKLDTKS